MLTESAFKFKAETLRCTLGRRVVIVALPLIAPIAKLIENILHEQELRFGCSRFTRNERPPIDVPDLDCAMNRVDTHQRLTACDLAACLIDDCKEQRIFTC